MTARIAVAVLAAALLATPAVAAHGSDFKRCRAVVRDGVRNPVRAHAMPCAKARRLARQLVRRHKLPAHWTSNNPAGCEHQIFRRRDRAAVQRGDLGDLPLATVIDNVHCNS
jgi:hypothetical protein